MTRRIVVERAAEEDLFEAVDYSMRQRTPATSRRFVTAAQETFARLAETPDIGHRYQTTHPRLQHLHVWRVRVFDRYLIFYHATEQTLFIERVLHGARDIGRLLGQEKPQFVWQNHEDSKIICLPLRIRTTRGERSDAGKCTTSSP